MTSIPLLQHTERILDDCNLGRAARFVALLVLAAWLTSCTAFAGDAGDMRLNDPPTPSPGEALNATEMPPWPDCPLRSSFIREIVVGSGHETSQQALEAFLEQGQHDLPEGELILEAEEEDSVIWAWLDNGKKVGFIRATRASWGLWNVEGGEWCVTE